VQLTPPTFGGASHVPGLVDDTGDEFGDPHTPPQQSAALKQMSPICVQYDDAMLHVPPEHSPEQHSVFVVHVFPAVVHELTPAPPSVFPLPMGAHFPLMHVSVQHALPDVGHVSPSVTHWAALHVPLTHAPVQQSVATAHVPPALAHVPIVGAAPSSAGA
jgi:hypothetical protein